MEANCSLIRLTVRRLLLPSDARLWTEAGPGRGRPAVERADRQAGGGRRMRRTSAALEAMVGRAARAAAHASRAHPAYLRADQRRPDPPPPPPPSSWSPTTLAPRATQLQVACSSSLPPSGSGSPNSRPHTDRKRRRPIVSRPPCLSSKGELPQRTSSISSSRPTPGRPANLEQGRFRAEFRLRCRCRRRYAALDKRPDMIPRPARPQPAPQRSPEGARPAYGAGRRSKAHRTRSDPIWRDQQPPVATPTVGRLAGRPAGAASSRPQSEHPSGGPRDVCK